MISSPTTITSVYDYRDGREAVQDFLNRRGRFVQGNEIPVSVLDFAPRVPVTIVFKPNQQITITTP